LATRGGGGMSRAFDAIIIGTGQAGPALAGRLTKAGMTVAIVERHLVGGTCVNTGCMPTKTLVASAQVAHMARRSRDYGVLIDNVGIDMARVHARSRKVSEDSRTSNETWLREMKHCTLIFGHARLESPTTVRVGDELLTASRIFLNVGGRALIPDMPGIHEVDYLTNSSLLELDILPRHLVIIGGSYVGLEFAQIYRRLGADVTVVERSEHLIGREDTDVSQAVRDVLEAEGIVVRTAAECIRVARHAEGIVVEVDCAHDPAKTMGSHLLLAMGRVPNTDDLGLDRAGVETDARGYIKVDDSLATSVPGIWALGDCNGRGAFTHTAYNDFEIVADNLIDGATRKVTDRIPCYALFTDPPLGRVGMSANQALAAGHRIRVGRRPMSRVGRAVEKDERLGFMEIVVDADTDAILGGTILGTGGDEAIHTIIDTMANGATATKLRQTMHIHPTVSELIPTIAGEFK
jgi:pyruvate/2-oxoglutarate dehydrogenase complex dihydrolipoamide dehydrogenase (E3) component